MKWLEGEVWGGGREGVGGCGNLHDVVIIYTCTKC